MLDNAKCIIYGKRGDHKKPLADPSKVLLRVYRRSAMWRKVKAADAVTPAAPTAQPGSLPRAAHLPGLWRYLGGFW